MKFDLIDPTTGNALERGIEAGNAFFNYGRPEKKDGKRPEQLEVGESVRWIFTASYCKTVADVVRVA